MLVSGATAALFYLFGAEPVAGSGHDFQARLLTPITSYSQSGTRFAVKVLGPVAPAVGSTLPRGTVIRGVVRNVKSVGLGLKRERATLRLEFSGCETAAGEAFRCATTLHSVDNGRETVKKDNRIQGILAASNPHAWLHGIWYRPTTEFFARSPAGLTGTGGMIQSRLFDTPVGAALVIGSRLVLLRLPEPEIALGPGTDLILRVSVAPDAMPPAATVLVPKSSASEDLVERLRRVPTVVARSDQSPAEDVINIALFSTKDRLVTGFAVAGWSEAQPLNAKTFARTYAAFADMKNYPSAPVSALYYQGRLPDLVFQKSLNSLAKRHHIRLWEVPTPEGPLWLGAATHDTSIAFDWKRMTITHRIDSRIDRERSIVMNDLVEAGCLTGEQIIDRPELQAGLLAANRVLTDGSLAVGSLQNCGPIDSSVPVWEKRKRAAPVRLTRRVVLELRYYFTRGNAYYWTYQTVRWGFSSRRKAGNA